MRHFEHNDDENNNQPNHSEKELAQRTQLLQVSGLDWELPIFGEKVVRH
jgi:hypothetical protein